jgi:hypothetical protein
MNANLTISPYFIEIGRLLFFGPFGIAAPIIARFYPKLPGITREFSKKLPLGPETGNGENATNRCTLFAKLQK